MAILTREEILGAHDLQTEVVDVPEWGGEVKVRGLSASERDLWEAEFMSGRLTEIEFEDEETGERHRQRMNLEDARARLAARCMVDEDDERLFSDADVKALGQKSAVALQRVYEVARKLSGLSESDMEELVGNSSAGPGEGSPFASR